MGFDDFDDKPILPKPLSISIVLWKGLQNAPAIFEDLASIVHRKKKSLWQGKKQKLLISFIGGAVFCLPVLLWYGYWDDETTWAQAAVWYTIAIAATFAVVFFARKLRNCARHTHNDVSAQSDSSADGNKKTTKKKLQASVLERKEAKKVEQFQDRCCDTYLEKSHMEHKTGLHSRVVRVEELMHVAMRSLNFFKGKSFSSSKRKEKEMLEGKD